MQPDPVLAPEHDGSDVEQLELALVVVEQLLDSRLLVTESVGVLLGARLLNIASPLHSTLNFPKLTFGEMKSGQSRRDLSSLILLEL